MGISSSDSTDSFEEDEKLKKDPTSNPFKLKFGKVKSFFKQIGIDKKITLPKLKVQQS